VTTLLLDCPKYVDLETVRTRVEQSMNVLKWQVSCVELNSNILLERKENMNNENKNDNLKLPSSSSFIGHSGQAGRRQSKWDKRRKINKNTSANKKRHQL
jgi:hypothetical protein